MGLLCIFTLLMLAKVIFPLLHLLFNYTLGKRLFSKRHCLRKAGEWAIVTGSTDGIGKAYAEQLASDGLKIMLISRNKEKLETVAKSITDKYGVETRIVVADFTQNDIYKSIEDEINKLTSIACLVNNVGISYDYYTSYEKTSFIDQNFIHRIINCNMLSVAAMTKLVLPKMLAQANPNYKPAIISISSFAGCLNSPYLTLYGATKSFIRHFGNSLSAELCDQPIIIQTVCPTLVATALAKIKRTSFFIPSSQNYASNALDMLGVEQQTCGYIGHALQSYFVNLLPESMLTSKYKGFADKCSKKYKNE